MVGRSGHLPTPCMPRAALHSHCPEGCGSISRGAQSWVQEPAGYRRWHHGGNARHHRCGWGSSRLSSLDHDCNAANLSLAKATASFTLLPQHCKLKLFSCKIDVVAEALSGVEPSRGEGAALGTQGHLGSSPALPRAAASPPRAMLKAKQRLLCLLFSFSFFYLLRGHWPSIVPFRSSMLLVAGGGGVRDLQRLSAMQPGWRAPNQLPPHQLGPVKSVVERAERGLGNAAQRLPGVWSRFWSPRPAPSPSPSQLTRFSAAKDASLADSSNDSSFQGRAGLEDRGGSHQHGDPGWAGGAKKCPNSKVMRTARGRQQLVGHPVPEAQGAFGEAQPPKRSGCWEAGEWVRDGVGWVSGVEQHPDLLWGSRDPWLPGSGAHSTTAASEDEISAA